jgi:hypothetical protein
MAWQFLIDNQVSELPLKLSEICRNNGYRLLLDSKGTYLQSNDRGATFLKDGQWQIVLNASDSVQVRRYTLAHELGHIFLEHSLHDGKFGRSFGIQRTPKTPEEYQAERFAIDILAPACVLWGLNLHTAEDIAKVCGISIRSAQIRAERMQLLYQRNKFLSHPVERQVFQQFSQFVDNKQIF